MQGSKYNGQRFVHPPTGLHGRKLREASEGVTPYMEPRPLVLRHPRCVCVCVGSLRGEAGARVQLERLTRRWWFLSIE